MKEDELIPFTQYCSIKPRSEMVKHRTDIFIQSATAQWLSTQLYGSYTTTTVANDYDCPHGTRYVLGSRYDSILADNEWLKMELNQLKMELNRLKSGAT